MGLGDPANGTGETPVLRGFQASVSIPRLLGDGTIAIVASRFLAIGDNPTIQTGQPFEYIAIIAIILEAVIGNIENIQFVDGGTV